jgi:hypothetical protein
MLSLSLSESGFPRFGSDGINAFLESNACGVVDTDKFPTGVAGFGDFFEKILVNWTPLSSAGDEESISMRINDKDRIKYDTEVKGKSNIQGFPGLQGFDYGY